MTERREIRPDIEGVEWPAPVPPPERADDPHNPPLDDPEDGRYLEADDPRRLEAERRRGRRFADDDPELGILGTPEADTEGGDPG